MRIFVLGGTGYLGAKLIRELYINGNDIVATRRTNSDNSATKDINCYIKWIDTSLDCIELECKESPYDYMVNLICNYERNEVSRDEIIDSNLFYPLKVMNHLIGLGVKKYITIGTGLPCEFNLYSFTKKTYSNFGKFYSNIEKISFINIQLEMFYGYDEPENRFLPSVIRKMIKGEIVETTRGEQRRDIIRVDDVICALNKIISSNIYGYYDIPIGTGEGPTISELIDYIWEYTGKKSTVKKGSIEMRENEPDCVADLTVLETIIGEWKPLPWKLGIAQMVEKIKDYNWSI